MQSSVEIVDQTAAVWWPYVFHATWQAALLAAVVLAVVWLGRRWPSPLRYWLLVIALVKFAVPPMFAVGTGLFSRAGPAFSARVEKPVAIPATVERTPALEVPIVSPPLGPIPGAVEFTPPPLDEFAAQRPPRPAPRPMFVPPKPKFEGPDWKGSLLLLHLAGFVALAAWALVPALRLRRLSRRARTVKSGDLHARFARLARRVGLRRLPRLLVSKDPIAPMAFGIFRPVVFIPKSVMRSLSAAELDTMLAHELAHLRRWDPLVNWLQIALAAAWWFNPMVWLLNREIRKAREDCCDDFVLGLNIAGDSAYCDTLLHAASGIGAEAHAQAMLGFADRLHPLGRRLARIMDAGVPRSVRLSIAGILAVLVLGFVGLPGLRNEAGESAADEATREYDRFTFVRHNRKGGDTKNYSLVMARVTPGGFELKDVYAGREFVSSLRPLCVTGGRFYAVSRDTLFSIDMATGKRRDLAKNIMRSVYQSASAYKSGRLCALVKHEAGDVVLRVFDLRTESYREIGPLPKPAHFVRGVAVSPDGKWFAYFGRTTDDGRIRTNGDHQLHVVDLESGEVRKTGRPIQWREAMISSLAGGNPPFVLLDEKAVLVIESRPQKEKRDDDRMGFGDWVNWVVAVNVYTGEIRDVAPVPGRAAMVMSRLVPPQAGAPPILMARGRYLIDIEKGRLVEDDIRIGKYRLTGKTWPDEMQEWRVSEIYHGEKSLGRYKESANLAVSPDGKRIVWSTPSENNERRIQYYDAGERTVRTVSGGWCRNPFLWFSKEDLKPRKKPAAVPEGWTALPAAPRPTPKPKPPKPRPPRKDIREVLDLSISTDKETYSLHEPVRLNFGLKNKGNRKLSVVVPRADRRSMEIWFEGPGINRRLDHFFGGDDTNPVEYAKLDPGKSVTGAQEIELFQPGEYKLRATYRSNRVQCLEPGPELYGWGSSARTSFRVEKTADSEALLLDKMHRLINKYRAEYDRTPGWDGWRPSLEDIEKVGPKIVPLLVETLRMEIAGRGDELFPALLFRPLNKLAGPEVIPFYEECLGGESTEATRETALSGLEAVLRGHPETKDKVLPILISSLDNSYEKVRGQAAKILKGLYDPRVKERFEKALNDRNDEIRTIAARYLAACEGLDLAEWLARAQKDPTLARLIAARSIVGQLEGQWHLKKGEIPEGVWEGAANDRAKLAAFKQTLKAWEDWARENPRSSAKFFARDRSGWPETIGPTPERTENPGGAGSAEPARPGAEKSPSDLSDTFEVKTPHGVVQIPWGKPANGLRLALELVPEQKSYTMGQIIGARIYVQNLTSQPVQIQYHAMDVRTPAYVKDAAGRKMGIEHTQRAFMSTLAFGDHRIEPGKTVATKLESLAFADDLALEDSLMVGSSPVVPIVGAIVRTAPGRYSVAYPAEFWNYDGEGGATRLTGERMITVTSPLPEEDEIPLPSPVQEARTVAFPPDRRMGSSYMREWSVNDESQWRDLGWAQGTMSVPPGMDFKLWTWRLGTDDLSPLADFDANAIQALDIGKGEKQPEVSLKPLKGLTGLYSLRFRGPQVKQEDFAVLENLKSLRTLSLSCTPLNEAAMAHVGKLKDVRRLYLSWTPVTDAGLAHLEGMHWLQGLWLFSTGITDKGLAHLENLRELKWLDLQKTRITAAGLRRLQQALPGCTIVHSLGPVSAAEKPDPPRPKVAAATVSAPSDPPTPPRVSGKTLTVTSGGREVEIPWGETVNGLRLALELVPEQKSYAMGQVIGARIHVQNLTSQTVQIYYHGLDVRMPAYVKDAAGHNMKMEHTQRMRTTTRVFGHHRIEPGRTAATKLETLAFVNDVALEDSLMVGSPPMMPTAGALIRCKPGRYRVAYPGWFWKYDGQGSERRLTGERELAVTSPLPEEDEMPLPSPVQPARTVAFPPNRRMGSCHIREWSVSDESQWRNLGWAQGTMSVPPGVDLKLWTWRVGTDDLSPLADFDPNTLQALDIGKGDKQPEVSLKPLKGLTGLYSLRFRGPQIKQEDFAVLENLKSLRTLSLCGAPVNDDAMAHVGKLKDLRRLYLSRTPVTDAGLAHLEGMHWLQGLWLFETGITDEGLAHLENLPELKWLDLQHARITADGLARLQKALPGCYIVHSLAARHPMAIVAAAKTPKSNRATNDAPEAASESPPSRAHEDGNGAGEKAIDDWIERLGSANEQEKREAREALIEMGEAAVPALMALVEKSDPRTGEALSVLGSTAKISREVAPRLKEMADKQSWPPVAWMPFYRAIAENKNDEERIRILAVQEFKNFGRPVIPALREMMLSGDPFLHTWAQHVIVMIFNKEDPAAKEPFFAELIDKDPFAPKVPGYLTGITGARNSGRTHPMREKVKALYRERMNEKPDIPLARTLAYMIQDQLANTEILWQSHGDWAIGRSGRECPSESFVTLAEVLEYGIRHAEKNSDVWHEFAVGLVRLRMLQGDWEGLNAALTQLGCTPIPQKNRPWLCPPPADWSGDIGKKWGTAEPSMRSGNCQLVVQIQKGNGKGVAGFHVVVKPAPPPSNNRSVTTGEVRSFFGRPLPFGKGDALGYVGGDRAGLRYGVSDASGEVRLDRLPAGEMQLGILIPTANFPEAARDWDLWMEVKPGEFQRASMHRSPDTVGPNDPQAIVKLEAGKTTRYPLLVVRPRLDLNIDHYAQIDCESFELQWTGFDPPPGTPFQYELEMVLTRPGWDLRQIEDRTVIRSATETTRKTSWPVGKTGVGGMRLYPGNMYLFSVRAREESGTVLGRWGPVWVWTPWEYRRSRPPIRLGPGATDLPICSDVYFRAEHSHGDEEENYPQWCDRWLRENPEAFERDYVRLVRAWLHWHDGEKATARKQLVELIRQLPTGNLAHATTFRLINDIDAGMQPEKRLGFVAFEDLDPDEGVAGEGKADGADPPVGRKPFSELPRARLRGWGAAVEGAECRIRPGGLPSVVRIHWTADETPRLHAALRNRGTRNLLISQSRDLCELEVNGRWFTLPADVEPDIRPLPPEKAYHAVPIPLDGRWHHKETQKPLELSTGRHMIRLAFVARPAENDPGSPVRFVSNLVEVEILPVPKGPPVWGEAVNGLRAALEFLPEKRVYYVGDLLEVRLRLENVGGKPIRFTRQVGAHPDHPSRWTVEDSAGTTIPCLQNAMWDGPGSLDQRVLKPGQQVTLEYAERVRLGEPDPGTSSAHERIARIPGTGRYRFQYTLQLEEEQPGDWSGELKTAKRELNVVPVPLGGSDAAEIDRLIGVLELRWDARYDRKDELDAAISGLAAIGEAAIEPVVKAFNRSGQSFAFRHRAVQVFEAMASPRAQEVLLDIALGRTEAAEPSLKQWASRAYVATLKDKSAARNLLGSDVGGILNNALLALKGQPIDEPMLKRLEELLRSSGGEPHQDMTIRWAAAAVLSEDPGASYAPEKVSAIVDAIADVKNMPLAKKTYRPGYFTYGEATYRRYIDALARVQDAYFILRATMARLEGRPRQCVAIALAERGSVTERKEILAVLADPDAGLLRAWAARGLGKIGRTEDIAPLRKLAAADPLARDSRSDVAPPGGAQSIYPVREAAREAIAAIEANSAERFGGPERR